MVLNVHMTQDGSIQAYTCTEYIGAYRHLSRWNFACMAALPLAVAMVARLQVIQVFGGDLTLGRAN